MPKNYIDFIDAVTQARAAGHDVEKVILTEESMDTFMTDGNFTEQDEEKQNDLGEFSIPIKSGDGDYVLTVDGERYPL